MKSVITTAEVYGTSGEIGCLAYCCGTRFLIEGDFAMNVQMELENHMNEAKVTGFGRVLVSPCFREGKTYAIQASGLGSLEPNTLVMGWPDKWREQGKKHCAKVRHDSIS